MCPQNCRFHLEEEGKGVDKARLLPILSEVGIGSLSCKDGNKVKADKEKTKAGFTRAL